MFMVVVLLHDPHSVEIQFTDRYHDVSLWYNSEFIGPSTASHSGPEATKQAQILIMPPPCFTDGMRFLCWNAVFAHCQTKFFSLKHINLI